MQKSLPDSTWVQIEGQGMQRITSRTLIAAISTTMAGSAPVGLQMNTSIRLSPHQTLVLDDRGPLAQPCLVGTRRCLSLDETPPSPCLLSTERCPYTSNLLTPRRG